MNGELRVREMFPDHGQLHSFREVSPGSMLERMVGISEALRSVVSSARRVAPPDATLPTGTPK